MKHLLLLTLIFFTTFSAFGQDNKISRPDSISRFVMSRVSFELNKMEKFQKLLFDNNYSKIATYGNKIEGVISYTNVEKRINSKFGFGILSRFSENRDAENQASFLGYHFTLETGYDLIKSKDLILRPYYGVGIEYNKIKFVEGFSSAELGEIFNSDFKTFSISHFSVPLIAGLELGGNFNLYKGFTLQVTTFGGYKLNLIRDWKLEDVVDTDNRISLGGLFVGFGVGFNFDNNWNY
ncbi:MAG: autotransporter outer membrane beta-barrel domain-containing protein [Saprospiraceae bacterium]